MITKTDKKDLMLHAKGSITAEIKLLCSVSSDYYKTDDGFISVSGDSALLFGIDALSDELSSFFAFSGIKRIMGGNLPLPYNEFVVMKTAGAAAVPVSPEIKPAAEMISRVFSLPFPDIYSSLCEKVNRGLASVIYTGNSSAVLLHSEKGCLLTSVCAEPKGKGYGKAAVDEAVRTAEDTVYLLCDKSLISFYEKSGFHAIGTEKEYIL